MNPARCIAAVTVSTVTLLPMLALTAAVVAYDRIRLFARLPRPDDPELADIVERIETLNQTRRLNNGPLAH